MKVVSRDGQKKFFPSDLFHTLDIKACPKFSMDFGLKFTKGSAENGSKIHFTLQKMMDIAGFVFTDQFVCSMWFF